MFEQSVAFEKSKKSPWTFVVAILLEVIAIVATILLPLFFIASPEMPAPPRPIAHYLPHVELVRVKSSDVLRERAVHLSRPAWNIATLVAPSRVPHGIANLAGLEPLQMGSIGDTSAGFPDGVVNWGSEAPQLPPPPPISKTQAARPGPLRVSQGVQEAKLIRRVMPRYPPLAVQTREFGTVHLVAIIGRDGRVRNVQVLDGPMFLRQAAVEAIKQWVYRPTLLNGEPVDVIAPIDVHFTLNN
ncbi:MAG TPA: energy transducer TonB [Bryobacteraceae bacterium]|jgi:protein TonB|nr:energy transducer TonB [Bryobacteraceae bacterium]